MRKQTAKHILATMVLCWVLYGMLVQIRLEKEDSSGAEDVRDLGINFENFSYNSSISRGDNLKVSERGGDRKKATPRVIILWTTWRSGSTYIGRLLSTALPNTFYSTEPLQLWQHKILYKDDFDTSLAVKYLDELLKCRVSNSFAKALYRLTVSAYYMRWNTYLSESCVPRSLCYNPEYVSQKCMEANLHVAKIIRLPLKHAWSFLQDSELDLQVIHLVRDPRAVLASRVKYPWWCGKKTCGEAETVCQLLEGDLIEAEKLQRKFPKRFKFIQYERINKDPDAGLREIMAFLSLPVSEEQLRVLKPEIASPDDFFSIEKNATAMVDRWRTKNEFEIIQYFQNMCQKPISMLGLRAFRDEEEFRNISLPLVVSNNFLQLEKTIA